MRFGLLVFLLLLVAAPAASSTLDDWFEVYREDFVSESMAPTSPEIDEVGAGGLSLDDEPAGLAPPPLFTGDALRFFTNGVSTSRQRADAFPTTIGTDSFGVRGRFEALEASVLNHPVNVSVNAAFEPDAAGIVFGVGLLIRLEPDPPGPPRVLLVLGESEFDPLAVPQSTTRSREILLAAPLANLVQQGGFGLELVVERSGTGEIYGVLTDPETGFSRRTADFALTDYSSQSLERISAILTAEVSGSVAQVDVTELGVFLPFTSDFSAVLGDGEDASPGDGQCATATGDCTLRAAIQEANAEPGPGRIELGEGEYVLSIAGTDEDAAATGDLDVLDDLEIVGAGSQGLVQTEVDANALDRVFHVPSGALDTILRIRDLRIVDGRSISVAGAYGGGLASWGRTTLERVFVADNVSNVGGGIFNARTLWLTDSIVTANLAQTLFLTGRGGGLAGGSLELGAQTFNSRTTILRSAIVDNESTEGGAGVDFGRAAVADVRVSTVASNLGADVFSWNSPLVLDHATVVSDVGSGVETLLAQGASSARFVQSAISGLPACDLSTFPVFQTFYEGNNASNDDSCGFTAPGSVESTDLLLDPVDPEISGTFAWAPLAGSPLIDAGDPATACPTVDQSGGPRPLDGDGDGSTLCDVGAIEVPEPGLAWGLVVGALWLSGAVRRRDGGSAAR